MKPENQIIAARYKIISELGAGSIGVVYKCHDQVMDNIVALKLLLDVDSMDGARRFHLEAKATAKLEHAHIVKILDFGEEEGRLYIVLEFVEGESLESVHEKDKIEFQEAISIFIQIASALAYANRHNVLHRDLKPSNIIITGDNLVKIVDFGLAKINTENQSLTKTGMAIGTPAYMSPEAAMGQKLDIRSDIFSLGCIMYETLTGKLPFDAESSMTQMLVRTNQDAPGLNSVEDQFFPDKLVDIVDKCLCSNPDDRYQSFEEIEKQLLEFQTSQETAITQNEQIPKEKTEALIESRKRKNSKIFVIGIIALLCIGIYPLYSLVTRPQKKKTNAFTKEADVFSALQADDLDVKVKLIKLDGKLWHSLWGISYTEDLDKLNAFDDIVHLKLLEGNLVGVQSSILRDLKLKSLDIKLSVVSDDTLKNISAIKQLTFLRMDKVHGIKLSGFKHLTKLENLEELSVRKTDIDDDIIPYIAEMKNLRVLYLGDSRNLTGKNLDLLANLPHLKELYLDGGKLYPQYLPNLEKLGTLEFLDMRHSGITDSKLQKFENLRAQSLDIRANPISPQGWQSFSKMNNLKILYLSYKKSKVKDSDRKKLKKSLPGCKVAFTAQ